MIHELLDFTRVRFAAGIPLEPQNTNISVLCKDVVSEAELANPGRAFPLSITGDCVGTWDPSRISEALSNLVGNAVQYGAPGTPIAIRVHGEGNEVVIEVHNEGSPIPAAARASLFDPFRRGTSRAKTGLGLGLYITREIVVAHGGEIEVHSTAQAGTTFSIRLPRTAPPQVFAHPEREQPPAAWTH
jgi:phosphoserine phosphatase RsbU/P